MLDSVKQYYGEILKSSADLQTNACCSAERLPGFAEAVIGKLHEEVVSRYYGCGLVLPEVLEGARVLDLGCGSGRDCYLLSALVGEHGHVVGVDMTEAQLDVARRHVDYHTETFGYAQPNVAFLEGDIEQLETLGLAPRSFDVVVSNCVVNLVDDKAAVLRGVQELLAPGGEMYFSDVYADSRVPEALKADPVLRGECLSGALYWGDFIDLARDAGFTDPRLVTERPLKIGNAELAGRVGPIRFRSATWRLFKLPGLERTREQQGDTVAYRGNAAHYPERIRLDEQYSFDKGEAVPVCVNTRRMLQESRFRPHFDFNP